MVNPLSFGVSDIDGLLGGGLLKGNSYLLETERGTEPDAFIASFIEGGCCHEEFCTVVSYDVGHEELIKRLTRFIDIKEKLDRGALIIIDMWAKAKNGYDPTGPILMTGKPKDINTVAKLSYELIEQVPKRMQNGNFRGMRVVTYSLLSMITNYKFGPTYRWTKSGLGLTRQANVTALTILDPTVFDGITVAAFEHLNDGIIILSMKELAAKNQRYIRIKQSPMSGFSTRVVPYDIADKKPRLLMKPEQFGA